MFDFILTLLFFASMEVASKPLMGIVDPLTLTFWRFVCGFGVILIFAVAAGKIGELKRISRNNFLILLLAGFLNTFFSMYMLQLAVLHGAAGTAALIFCSNPLLVYLIQIVRKEERGSVLTFSALIIALLGLIIIMLDNLTFSGAFVYALLASLSFALFTVINKKASGQVHPLNMNLVSFACGLLCTVLFQLLIGKNLLPPAVLLENMKNLSLFLYLGIGVSGLGYITFIRTIRRYSATSASVIFLLKPVLAALFALLVLAEKPGMFFGIGLLLVFTGSFLLLKGKRLLTANHSLM